MPCARSSRSACETALSLMPDRDGEIGDAQVTRVVQGEHDAEPVDVAQRVQHGRGVVELGTVGEHRGGVAHLVGVDHAHGSARGRDLVHTGEPTA